MKKVSLVTSDAAVSRRVGNEIIVVQLNTGQMLYFSETMQDVLDFFSRPRTLQQFLSAAGLEGNKAEAEYLQHFARFLQDQEILVESPESDDTIAPVLNYTRPTFLRVDEKTLDQVAFLYP